MKKNVWGLGAALLLSVVLTSGCVKGRRGVKHQSESDAGVKALRIDQFSAGETALPLTGAVDEPAVQLSGSCEPGKSLKFTTKESSLSNWEAAAPTEANCPS